MFLPLGHIGKPPKVAWVTLILSVLMLVFTIDNFRQIKAYQQQVFESARTLGLYAHRAKVFEKYCLVDMLQDPDMCRGGVAMINSMDKVFTNYVVIKENDIDHDIRLYDPKNNPVILFAFVRQLDLKRIVDRQVASVDDKKKIFEELLAEPKYQKFFAEVEPFMRAEDLHIERSNAAYWQEYEEFEDEWKREKKRLAKKNNFLTHDNQNFASYLKAQFTHSSYSHLAGNLVFFTVFSYFVEARLGLFLFSLIYLFGGTIGLSFHLNLMSSADDVRLLIGASANVSALMGAFYMLFYHHRMNLLLMYLPPIPFGKIFQAQIKYLFPLFFIAADVIGFVSGSFDPLSQVAHGAHLVGFVLGALFGYGVRRYSPLTKSFAYKEERAEFDLLRTDLENGDIALAMERFEKIRAMNPDNLMVLDYLMQSSAVAKKDENDPFDGFRHQFYQKNLSSYFAQAVRKRHFRNAHELLQYFPLDWPLHRYLDKTSAKMLLRQINWEIKYDHWFEIIRLYNVYLTKYPKGVEAPLMMENTRKIMLQLKFKEGPDNMDNINKMIQFLKVNPKSRIKNTIKVVFDISEEDIRGSSPEKAA